MNKFSGQSPSNTPSGEECPELTAEGIRAVQIIVREIGSGWEFGYWDSEELLQQAYVWAIEALPHWDSERNLYTFLNVVIRRKLFNLRRNKFERHERPCHNCPLEAFLPPDGCSAYEEKRNCELYNNWLVRNERKKSVMNGRLEEDIPREPPPFPLEVADELDWYKERVRDKVAFELLRNGQRLDPVRKNSLMEELAALHAERVGD